MENLSDMSAVEAMLYGDVEGDAELEAELLALQEEDEHIVARPKQRNIQSAPAARHPTNLGASTKPTPNSRAPPRRPVRKEVDLADIDRLARRISEEANVLDDDNDDTVENDEDLLDELSNLVGPSDTSNPVAQSSRKASQPSSTCDVDNDMICVIQERLKMYTVAELNARQEGNASNTRRYGRGIKTLQCQLKQLTNGGCVDEESVPPLIVLKKSVPNQLDIPDKHLNPSGHSAPSLPSQCEKPRDKPVPRVSLPPSTPVNQKEYKTIVKDDSSDADLRVLIERRDGYKKLATSSLRAGDKTKAQWAYKVCKQFDAVISAAEGGQSIDVSNMPPPAPSLPPTPITEKPPAMNSLKSVDKAQCPVVNAPAIEPPKTIVEGLEQRMNKYKESAEKATAAGDDRKARMMGRIVKQYQDAMRSHKAGRSVDFDELPCPPGCAPLPTSNLPASSSTPTLPTPVPAVAASPPRVAGEKAAGTVKPAGPPTKASRQEQQLQVLMNRQLQFKKEALMAKKRGDVEKAKEFLRQAKGFDQMIEASRAGLPVNVTSTPTPPQSTTNLKSTMAGDAEAEGWSVVRGNTEAVYVTLEKDLIRQIQICQQNMEYFSKLGEVSRIAEFEKLAAHNKRDLVALRQSFKFNDPPPRFKYIMKSFPSLQCNPDLTDDILELIIVRGLQIRLAHGYDIADADLFVKYEFPFPQETPQTGKINPVKGTCSPVFNEVIKLKINRSSRHLLRVFKRNGIKMEVFQKGSWIRNDKSLGACEVKLAPLESKSNLHVSVDLMEGRKACGGKLEVKMRVRQPLVQQTTELVKEKWLIISDAR